MAAREEKRNSLNLIKWMARGSDTAEKRQRERKELDR